jgi:TolB-like protein/tetratricopeptide (TPR) repeat protein
MTRPDPPNADDPLDELSESVLKGEPRDWALDETKDGLDPEAVRALRDVERIADFSRQLQRTPPPPPPGAPANWTAGPPKPWGHLMLLEVIGAGARGAVWRAWDPTLQREVALKFLQDSGAPSTSGSSLLELLSEARALARVHHRAVATVHGIAEHDGRAGMWMEYLRGPSLAREMERSGPLPPRRVVHIGLELCAALEALEAADLVHRDIKPANIVIEADNRVVLTDFGLGWRPALDETQPPRSSGTPIFMSPEMLAGEVPTHRSDLYALGVTLWWALAGQVPFQAKSIHDLREEAAQGPSRALATLCPDAPADLISAIEWAMSRAAADRPSSAASLASRLRLVQRRIEDDGAREGVASIAVLPFINRSPSADDEYFSDGLADELLNVLCKIKGLRVLARASSFRFKDRQAPLAEIGKALRVATILDGSVYKAGNRVRVSVQLVNVSDGAHLWSETYDRTIDDMFAVQDDIAQSVVSQLRTTLLGQKPDSDTSGRAKAEVAAASKGRSSNPEAHRLYLQARHFVDRFNRQEMAKAIDYLKEALALDPQFADAWAELARAHAAGADAGWDPPVEAYERSRVAAKRALELQPDLAEGHVRMGRIQRNYDRDWPGAKASYARALELDPGNAVVLSGAGALAMNLGRFDEAIDLYQRALDRDPLNAGTYHNVGLPLFYTGRLVEAEAALRKALELAPQTVGTRCFLSWTLLAQGRGEEALTTAMQEPEEWIRLWALVALHHGARRAAESDAALQALIEKYADCATFQIAEACALRGEADEAFKWLDRAYALKDSGLSDLKASPRLRSLHEDSRWPPLLEKLGAA